MKVSIIVPFYKSLNIKNLLNTLLNQSYNNIEILCIGDKVEDESHSVVKEYTLLYPEKIFFYLQDGRGSGSARNFGLSLAKGDYIMFADADDYVEYGIVKKLWNHLKKTNVDFVCCSFDRISKSGHIYSKEMMSNNYQSSFFVTLNNIKELAFISPAPWGKLFKLSLIGDTRFPESQLMAYEDLIFFLLLCPKIKSFSILPEILYHYVVDEPLSKVKSSIDKSKAFRVDLLKVRSYYNQLDLPIEFHTLLDLVAFIHIGIADTYRIAENSKIQLYPFILEAKTFLDTFFPGWRNIPLIHGKRVKIRHICIYGLKVILMVNVFLYKIIIQLYIFIIKKCHIDMKW